MKKILLSLAAVVAINGNIMAESWGVVGTFSNWDNDVEMTQVEENVYSVTMSSLQGEFKFRADYSWALNFGAGVVPNVTGNGDYEMVRDGQNFNAPEELTNVTLTINTANATLTVTGLGSDADTTPYYMKTDNWGVIGSFNNWDVDVDMTKMADYTYSVTLPYLQGEFGFRADNQWNILFGALDSWAVNGNGQFSMALNGRYFYMSHTVENVTLTINTKEKTLTVSGLEQDQETTMELYLIGDPAGVWDTSVGNFMDIVEPDKIFTWNGYMQRNSYFSFVKALNSDSDWESLNAQRFGPSQDGTDMSTTTLNQMEYPRATSWRVSSGNFYNLTVDVENLTLKSEIMDNSWGLIGDFNGWTDDVPMEKIADDIFTVTVNDFYGHFKFRANKDWMYQFGAGYGGEYIIEDGQYQGDVSGNSPDFNVPYGLPQVTFTIDLNNCILYVDVNNGSGINSVSADEAETEYFNLQGIKISNPESGIYIRKIGNNLEKVIK